MRRTAWFLLGSLNPLARILEVQGAWFPKPCHKAQPLSLPFFFIGNVTLARWARPRVTGFQQWAAAARGSWPSAGLGFVLLWGLGEQRQCFIARSSLLGHHWPGGVSVLILSAQSWHYLFNHCASKSDKWHRQNTWAFELVDFSAVSLLLLYSGKTEPPRKKVPSSKTDPGFLYTCRTATDAESSARN